MHRSDDQFGGEIGLPCEVSELRAQAQWFFASRSIDESVSTAQNDRRTLRVAYEFAKLPVMLGEPFRRGEAG